MRTCLRGIFYENMRNSWNGCEKRQQCNEFWRNDAKFSNKITKIWNEMGNHKNVDLGERKMKPSSQNPALVQPWTILRKGPKMVSLKDFKSGREQCRNTFFFVRRHAIWYDIHTEDGLVFIPDLRGSLGPLLFLHFLLREYKMRKRKPTSAPNDARTLKIDHPILQIPCVQWSKARRVKEWS